MRVALARTGVVLTGDGGALKTMLPPFKAGIGGPVAGGEQYVPWIGLADEVAALIFLLDTEAASGPINLTAPKPATNGELSRPSARCCAGPAMRRSRRSRSKLLYGEMAQIVVTGRQRGGQAAHELGFTTSTPSSSPARRAALGKT